MFTTIVKSLVPITIMILILMGIEIFLPINNNFLKIIVYGIVGGITYIGISYSMGILTELFGKEYLNKIIKKLTFGKFEIKN